MAAEGSPFDVMLAAVGAGTLLAGFMSARVHSQLDRLADRFGEATSLIDARASDAPTRHIDPADFNDRMRAIVHPLRLDRVTRHTLFGLTTIFAAAFGFAVWLTATGDGASSSAWMVLGLLAIVVAISAIDTRLVIAKVHEERQRGLSIYAAITRLGAWDESVDPNSSLSRFQRLLVGEPSTDPSSAVFYARSSMDDCDLSDTEKWLIASEAATDVAERYPAVAFAPIVALTAGLIASKFDDDSWQLAADADEPEPVLDALRKRHLPLIHRFRELTGNPGDLGKVASTELLYLALFLSATPSNWQDDDYPSLGELRRALVPIRESAEMESRLIEPGPTWGLALISTLDLVTNGKDTDAMQCLAESIEGFLEVAERKGDLEDHYVWPYDMGLSKAARSVLLVGGSGALNGLGAGVLTEDGWDTSYRLDWRDTAEVEKVTKRLSLKEPRLDRGTLTPIDATVGVTVPGRALCEVSVFGQPLSNLLEVLLFHKIESLILFGSDLPMPPAGTLDERVRWMYANDPIQMWLNHVAQVRRQPAPAT